MGSTTQAEIDKILKLKWKSISFFYHLKIILGHQYPRIKAERTLRFQHFHSTLIRLWLSQNDFGINYNHSVRSND